MARPHRPARPPEADREQSDPAPAGPGRSRHDAVVVLGAGVASGGRPTAALRRRTAHGATMVLAGAAEYLVLSGGRPERGAAEAEVMRRLAVEAGVHDAHIVLEPEARSTLENAAFTVRLARARGWASLLVVTERYHLPRALAGFRRAGVAVAGSPAPADPRLRRRVAASSAELIKWPPYVLRLAFRDFSSPRRGA